VKIYKDDVFGTSELSITPFSLPVTAAAEPVARHHGERGILRAVTLNPSLTPANLDSFAVDERIGHLLAGFVEVFPDRSPGDPHDGTCLFLRKTVQIDKFQEF